MATQSVLDVLVALALWCATSAASDVSVTVKSDSRLVLPRELVAPGELRVTVAGSGMPYTRRAQAAASFLVELGDEQQTTLLFDLGTGSLANVNAAGVDYSRLNTVFLTHYHVDHTGDLSALLGAGLVMGRQLPLHIYGPSGKIPEHGLDHFCDGLRRFTRWDVDSRLGRVPSGGADELVCHEFDYTKAKQIVYSEGGVVVTASPVVHITDGPVAYRLDWRGRSFVFSGDTKPSNNMVELAQDADIFVHEAFVSPAVLAHAMNLDIPTASHIVEHIHTPVRAAARIFQLTKPKLAVAYHLWLQPEDLPTIMDELRREYAGPVAVADDLMAFEIHDGGVRQRQRLLVERPFPLPSRGVGPPCRDDTCKASTEPPQVDVARRFGLSDFLLKTVIPMA